MKISKRVILALILAFGVAGASISTYFIVNYFGSTGNGSDGNGSEEKSIDTKIQELMAEYEIPSLAAGILINNSIVWANGFGNQSSLDTVYMIGSITKTFTATAILQLKEKNLLNLDKDINNYIPFNVRHPNYSSTPVTTRMLLTHLAGLPTNLYWSLEYYLDNQTIEWINDNLGWDIIIPWVKRPTLEEFLNGSLNPSGPYYNDYNWQAEPGTGHFIYSNAGFQLLGYLVEEITNQSLESYIQENIFDPLNMTDSGYFYTDFIGKHAIPYERRFGSNLELPLYNLNVTGAGSIRSNVLDMAKYMNAFMNKGEANGTRILSRESVALMHSVQEAFTGTSVEGLTYEGYGLGWFLYDGNYKGHGGATPGFSSSMFLKNTNKGSFGVILMFNRGMALIFDSFLIYNIIPEINSLLLEEAENLFY
jgi:CubicO group peptidase (beta-lactamase class C family)